VFPHIAYIFPRRAITGSTFTGPGAGSHRLGESPEPSVIQFLRWTHSLGAITIGDMDELLPCREHWQAVDAARNIARDYRLTVTTDLFGWVIVERQWGRIGCAGRSARDTFAEPKAAQRFIAEIRARRRSAKKRIGVAYRAVRPN